MALHPKVERLFVGREAQLHALHDALLPARGQARPVAVCSVQGMPGVGKSYLVDRFYVLHRERFPGGYQRLTLSPTSLTDADTLLARLAEALRLPSGFADRDARLAAALRQGPTLVHIENVDSPAAAELAVALVERLPGVPLALSGRLQGLGQDAGWARVPLRPFEEAAALEQLARELETERGRPRLEAGHRTLVRALGWLPLAIHLAAGHLRKGRSVDGFLRKLRAQGLDLAPADPADPGLRNDRARAILKTTFELSLGLLAGDLGAEALAAFRCLGHAPPSGFGPSLGAALAALDGDPFDDLCVEAFDLSLLDAEPAPDGQRRWRIHPLLGEYLRQGSDGAQALARIGAWFLERLPEGGDWSAVHAEGDALTDWLQRAPPEQRVRIERAGSRYAIRNGPFQAWAAFCEAALAADPQPAERSNLLWTLGNVARSAGQPERAMQVAEQKAALDRERGDEREAALAMGRVADILQARGELDEALRIRREEQLPVYERLGDVRELLVARANLAIGYLRRGSSQDLQQAKELLCLALQAARRLRIPEAQAIEGILQQAGLSCV